MREAKRSPELWEGGKRYAFPAFPQLLLLNKVESINPDTSGKHQPGRSETGSVARSRAYECHDDEGEEEPRASHREIPVFSLRTRTHGQLLFIRLFPVARKSA